MKLPDVRIVDVYVEVDDYGATVRTSDYMSCPRCSAMVMPNAEHRCGSHVATIRLSIAERRMLAAVTGDPSIPMKARLTPEDCRQYGALVSKQTGLSTPKYRTAESLMRKLTEAYRQPASQRGRA